MVSFHIDEYRFDRLLTPMDAKIKLKAAALSGGKFRHPTESAFDAPIERKPRGRLQSGYVARFDGGRVFPNR